MALLSIALIHLLDLQGKLDELPYVGVLFIGLIIVSLVLAEALIRTDDLRVWLMVGCRFCGDDDQVRHQPHCGSTR